MQAVAPQQDKAQKQSSRGSQPSRKGDHQPNINRFFSGSRFPCATLSSMDDQIFFLGPSLLDGRLLCPVLERFNVDMFYWNSVQPALTMLRYRKWFLSYTTR